MMLARFSPRLAGAALMAMCVHFAAAQSQPDADKLNDMQRTQQQLLLELKRKLAAMPVYDRQRDGDSADLQDNERKRLEWVAQLAEIERRIHLEKTSRKGYIVPSTHDPAYLAYYKSVRTAIEEKGSKDFPNFDGKPAYGKLKLVITIDHTGAVLATEVAQSSGNPRLDDYSGQVARAAGPFAAFTKAMRQRADQVMIITDFTYAHDEPGPAKPAQP